MRGLVFICLCLSCVGVLMGQPHQFRSQVDSIAKLYASDFQSLDTALILLEQTQSVMTADKRDYAQYARVFNLYRGGQLDEAVQLAKTTLVTIGDSLPPSRVAGYQNIVGTSYYDQDQIDSATVYFVAAASNLEAADNSRYAGYVYNNLAGIYRKYDDCNQALVYYRQAVTMLEQAKDTAVWSLGLTNMAGCHRKLGDMQKALTNAEKALQLADAVGAKKSRLQAISVIANVRREQGDTLKAIELFRQIFNDASPTMLAPEYYDAALALGGMLQGQRGLGFAEEAYLLSKERFRSTQDQAIVIYTNRLAEVGKSEQAFTLLRELYEQQDTALRAEYEGVQQELLKQFEVAQKDAALAEQDAKLKVQKLRNQRLLGGLGLLGFGLLGLLLAYRQYRRNTQLQTQASEEGYHRKYAELETMVLKSKMNPHFIFNSLNSIRHLFMKDQKEEGLRYITKFAKLLRNTLNVGDQALIPLHEELELTELFAELERLRFVDTDFDFLKDYDEKSLQTLQVPPFVLQPLVENAFWHGLSPLTDRVKRLSITVEQVDDHKWAVRVIDNGVGHQSANKMASGEDLGKTKSFGTQLIRDRFKLIESTQPWSYQLQLSSGQPQGTVASIIIHKQ